MAGTKTGSAGAPISQSGSGARCARITPPMATPGATFRTIWLAGALYRWGEDGLLGWCDRQCRLVFALALWNRKDPFIKVRLYGLAGPEGNHGEDFKECYYYLDYTPTHSSIKCHYKKPKEEFPYSSLIA